MENPLAQDPGLSRSPYPYQYPTPRPWGRPWGAPLDTDSRGTGDGAGSWCWSGPGAAVPGDTRTGQGGPKGAERGAATPTVLGNARVHRAPHVRTPRAPTQVDTCLPPRYPAETW